MAQRPDNAVLAAITTAVTNYIRTEEDSFATAAAPVDVTPAQPVTSSLYAASGRQQMMEMRRLLSMRLNRH